MRAAKAAWGCVEAIEARRLREEVQRLTFTSVSAKAEVALEK